MPPDDANFSTPLGGWKVSALHSTFLRGKCERFWTLPVAGKEGGFLMRKAGRQEKSAYSGKFVSGRKGPTILVLQRNCRAFIR